jgi:hypothetical protein
MKKSSIITNDRETLAQCQKMTLTLELDCTSTPPFSSSDNADTWGLELVRLPVAM